MSVISTINVGVKVHTPKLLQLDLKGLLAIMLYAISTFVFCHTNNIRRFSDSAGDSGRRLNAQGNFDFEGIDAFPWMKLYSANDTDVSLTEVSSSNGLQP